MLRGRISTTFDVGDRRGQQRVGDYLVPPAVVVTMKGDAGNPNASIRFEARDGGITCTAFTVTAVAGGRGLRNSDLTTINIDGIGESAFLDWATPVGKDRAPMGPSDDREEWAMRADIGEAQKIPGPSRAELEEVARIYRSVSTAPVAAVESAFGYSRRTASRRVKQAREAGLLDG